MWPASYPIHIVVKTTKMTALTILMIILAYLGGSLSSAVLVSRLTGLPDPRDHGSHNPGATNVLRTGNKNLALATVLLDSGKGAIAVLLARFLTDDPIILWGTGLAAIIGHNYPVWLAFKGGKGVATSIGTLLALNWMVGASICLIWLVMAILFRISSLAALAAFFFLPAIVLFLVGLQAVPFAVVITLLLFWRHRGNIARLWRGEEPVMSFGKK